MTSGAPEPSAAAAQQASGPARLMRLLAGGVAWIGASLGALTAILMAVGYLVEGGWLASFGLNRGMLELATIEYVATGGQFMLGLLPLSLAGALNFLLDFWWAALLLPAACALAARGRLGTASRWALATLANSLWLACAIPLLDDAAPGSEAHRVVSMMSFVVLLSLLYAGTEYLSAQAPVPRGARVAQVLFAAVLSVSMLTLPYARGSKGLVRALPRVQLPQQEAAVLCQMANPAADAAACAARSWQLVQLGKSRSILLDPAEGALYLVPAAATSTLRIIGLAPKP